jgi:hypothetical protein
MPANRQHALAIECYILDIAGVAAIGVLRLQKARKIHTTNIQPKAPIACKIAKMANP